MSEMVERVAEAIWTAKFRFQEPERWEAAFENTKVELRVEARAAIAAMRGPTWDMVSAAGNIEIERPGNDETNSTHELWPKEVTAVWRAMIDEALK